MKRSEVDEMVRRADPVDGATVRAWQALPASLNLRPLGSRRARARAWRNASFQVLMVRKIPAPSNSGPRRRSEGSKSSVPARWRAGQQKASSGRLDRSFGEARPFPSGR